MTTIYTGNKLHHDGETHDEVIEVNEETLELFHTITAPDGTVVHSMTRKLSPGELQQYLSHREHWENERKKEEDGQ